MVLLLDTNVVSMFLKTSTVHDTRRQAIEAHVLGNIPAISFVTVAELLAWAESKGWGEKKRAELETLLRVYTILDPTRETAEMWAKTKIKCESAGAKKQPHDLWVAAAALQYDLEVVTADSDFDGIPGLRVKKL